MASTKDTNKTLNTSNNSNNPQNSPYESESEENGDYRIKNGWEFVRVEPKA